MRCINRCNACGRLASSARSSQPSSRSPAAFATRRGIYSATDASAQHQQWGARNERSLKTGLRHHARFLTRTTTTTGTMMMMIPCVGGTTDSAPRKLTAYGELGYPSNRVETGGTRSLTSARDASGSRVVQIGSEVSANMSGVKFGAGSAEHSSCRS